MHRMMLVGFLAVVHVLSVGGFSKPAPESLEPAHYPVRGKGGSTFRGISHTPLTGTTDWSTEETYFLLEKG